MATYVSHPSFSLSMPSLPLFIFAASRSMHGVDKSRNQEVTLTTTEPNMRLKILGITPDHGLLRCTPLNSHKTIYERDDYSDDRTTRMGKKVDSGYVDLQPDGNSFDLMSGLIKRKI